MVARFRAGESQHFPPKFTVLYKVLNISFGIPEMDRRRRMEVAQKYWTPTIAHAIVVLQIYGNGNGKSYPPPKKTKIKYNL